MPNDVSSGSTGVPTEIAKPLAINLDELDRKLYDGVDLIGYKLTGQARLIHDLSSHNFISCVFDGAFMNEIDLTRCDFKDVLITNSHFRRCKIQAATHTTTVYIKSVFEECDFTNAAQTNCEFREVKFIRCQLSNLLTKSSRLYDCTFVECETKTHVFEGNVFLRCYFHQTDLEVRTIVSNFGLKRAFMTDGRIRNRRTTEDYGILDYTAIERLADERKADPLALLSILYYLRGNLLEGGKDVDEAFNVKSWLRLARQPASFAQLVELLAEFLMNAYEDNEVDMHKILLLHDITRQIVIGDEAEPSHYQLRLSFGGIHLALSRLVEEYLSVLQDLTSQPGNVRVAANGPLVREYYEAALGGVLKHCGVGIAAVRPRNSPIELEFLELLPGGKLLLIALLLATFVRFELRATPVVNSVTVGSASKSDKLHRQELIADPAFFQLTAGMATEVKRAYELRVKSLIPTTSIVVDLKLSVSTEFVRKIRETIVGLLQGSTKS